MSEKNLDKHGRWRNKTIAFRVTPEEYEKIKALVSLSGMTTQEYILKRLENREVFVVGNPRVHKALKGHMEKIYQEMKRVADISELDSETLEVIDYLGHVYDGMRMDCRTQQH